MPRSVQDILKHADELAKRFEDYEPMAEDERDPVAVSELRQAVTARSDAERSIRDAVARARQASLSWAMSAPCSAPPERRLASATARHTRPAGETNETNALPPVVTAGHTFRGGPPPPAPRA